MPSSTLPTLSPDDLDDLIYATRTAEISLLKDLITALCATHACAPATILSSAIDIDADDEGTGSCLLHYPAANGNLEVLKYLLSLLRFGDVDASNGVNGSGPTREVDVSPSTLAHELVNHKNKSGNTPLHWASMNGHLEVVKALVQAGADATVKNGVGRDCVVEAEVAGENGRDGCSECVVWMLQNCKGLDEITNVNGQQGEKASGDVDVEGTMDVEVDSKAAATLDGEGTIEGEQET